MQLLTWDCSHRQMKRRVDCGSFSALPPCPYNAGVAAGALAIKRTHTGRVQRNNTSFPWDRLHKESEKHSYANRGD